MSDLKGNFFCPLPWIHRFVSKNGTSVCCANTDHKNLSLNEFNNSDTVIRIKEEIKKGKIPDSCKTCYSLEERGFENTRITALNMFKYTVDDVPDNIEYYDLRYSNLCNFSCRTCNPEFSSLIEKEIEENSNLKEFYLPLDQRVNHDIVNNIEFEKIKILNLTGGEPTLIKENLQIFEKLIEIGNTNLSLLITTNASVINPKLLNILKHFTNLHWTISIDGIGSAAEYIRFGSNWETIEKNVQTILELGNSIQFNCTVSAYSILNLDSVINWFVDLKHKYSNQPLELTFFVLEYPWYLQIDNLPLDLIEQAISSCEKAKNIISKTTNFTANQETIIENLISKLKSVKIDKSKKFLKFTKMVDGIRNQNFNDLRKQ